MNEPDAAHASEPKPAPPAAPLLLHGALSLLLRAALLLCAAPLLALAPRDPLLQAAACGALFADVVSWVLVVLLTLPELGPRTLLEGLLLAAEVWLVDATLGLQRPAAGEPEAVAFLLFLLVSGGKLGWWALRRLDLW